jgi:hypothetical protein
MMARRGAVQAVQVSPLIIGYAIGARKNSEKRERGREERRERR